MTYHRALQEVIHPNLSKIYKAYENWVKRVEKAISAYEEMTVCENPG